MAFKMKAKGFGNNPMKKNFPSAFKQTDNDDKKWWEFWKKNSETNKPSETNDVKGKIGSEYRKAEYDARGWGYDDTIKGYNRDGTKKTPENKEQKKGRLKRSLSPETILSYGDGSGPDDVARAKKRASQRYHGLSDERIRQILKRDFNKATKRAARIKKMREEGTNPNKT